MSAPPPRRAAGRSLLAARWARAALPRTASPQAIAAREPPARPARPEPGHEHHAAQSRRAPRPSSVYLLEETATTCAWSRSSARSPTVSDPDDRLAALFGPADRGRGRRRDHDRHPRRHRRCATCTARRGDRRAGHRPLERDLLDRGPELAKAFAQIVWTATEPTRRATQVRFLVDGEPIQRPGRRRRRAGRRRRRARDYSDPGRRREPEPTRRTPGRRRRARGRPASARPPPPPAAPARRGRPGGRPSCPTPRRARRRWRRRRSASASTRSKAVGVPPRCTWPSVVTRVS